MTRLSAPQVRFESGVFIVRLGDDYSHLQENVLENLQIIPLLAESIEPAHIVIDLANVKFIGSAAIGHLVAVSQSLSKRGGTFGLLNLNKFCQTVIRMAKLSSILPDYDSIEQAAGAADAVR